MNLYATPGQVKEQIDKKSSVDDTHLLKALIGASRLVDEAAGRFFYPKRQVLTLDPPRVGGALWLPQPLLAVESIEFSEDYGRTWAYTLAETDYWLSDGSIEATPYQLLCLHPSGDYPLFYAGPRSVRVTGVWGWRREYAGAWAAVDTVQDDPLTSSSTSFVETMRSPSFAAFSMKSCGSRRASVTGSHRSHHRTSLPAFCAYAISLRVLSPM